MDLLLWRHAEAEEGGPSIADHKRRLTAAGEKQAKRMAEWLAKRLPKKCTLLVSPAERTQQTANALGLAYEIEPRVGTGADAGDLLAAARWPEGPGSANGTVLIVGHQPTLGQVASHLLTGNEGELSVKKGGLWWFSSRTRNGSTQVVLRAVINPDML